VIFLSIDRSLSASFDQKFLEQVIERGRKNLGNPDIKRIRIKVG
jgi:hypothetical protein